uniref:BZIP domain-containing protein n=1 Tax=Macrostomum lignano TaxID=282301 RepID=A0A1I8FIR5_9PLAT
MEVLMNKYRSADEAQREVDLAARQQPALAAAGSPRRLWRCREKVQEMACVMREALRREDDHVTQLEEDLTRLRTENATLRELLRIATAAAAAASGCASRSGSTSGAAAGASVGASEPQSGVQSSRHRVAFVGRFGLRSRVRVGVFYLTSVSGLTTNLTLL